MGDRSRKAAACLLLVSAISLLVPALAAAAGAPWVGTYKGVAVGKDKKGKKAVSGVTIWVEDLGGSSRFTFRFDKIPVVLSRTTRNAGGLNGSQLMRIAVNEAGVNGSGLIVVYPYRGNYQMAGKGAGKAMGKSGSGRLGAGRTATGVQLPSVADQITDLFGALVGRTPKTSSGSSDAGGGPSLSYASVLSVVADSSGVSGLSAGQTADEASGDAAAQDDQQAVIENAPEVESVQAAFVEPASAIDVASAKPPVTTQTVLAVTAALLVLGGVAALVGVGPRARRTVAAPAPHPGAGREGG